MLHTLHYDVAFFPPGHKRHPGPLKERFAFTPLTQRGSEQLDTAPFGVKINGCVYVSTDEQASGVMDHIEMIEVYMYQ